MENEIAKVALSQGIWAALSIVLIFYILKAQEKRDTTQEEREKRYQEIISNLSEKINLLEEVRRDMKQLKDLMSK
ncbi:BhlA/UviB family holin-like peptide [Lutispora thermophila]|uniref:BhlA holin family protein n=1 Tax=Lutispora thermophila DSM 19022 TaxID=1122184 RepID=A0A1M6IMZ0_9FIRM|nr:BhlA/UviB family holin-like peptide [Lutispora thermophila]SHJ35802.1 BhlA holin family protein [Lutispora thermophila DSM 19022]